MKLPKVSLITAIAVILAACGGGNEARTLQPGETLRVMASTPHLASLAMAIAGDDAKVEMLIAEGSSPHAWQPSISDRRRLQASHLLLINGLELEPWDAPKLAGDAKVKLIDCSAGIEESWLLTSEEEDEHEDHDHGHAHEHEHEHGEHNPHVWLSVDGAIKQAEAIAKAMGDADSSHAAEYTKRVTVLKESLLALHAEYEPKLKQLKKRRFVSNHDAFPYLAREFGLTQVGVIQRTPGSNPTIAERREIETILKEGKADAIFMEPGFDDAASRAIAESSGLPLAVLDPFGVGKPAPDALQAVLRKNLETVLKTLGD
ncbi:MAG: zinc ABC transporter substrate-binding protein [Planctomycetes bacterium]|nr:zinc ABC transporter substrate-binding protein [Planctomycetota bacterium]